MEKFIRNAVSPSDFPASSPSAVLQMRQIAEKTHKTFEIFLDSTVGGDWSLDRPESSEAAWVAESIDRTPLHVSAAFGKDKSLARELSNLKGKINEKDMDGRTALHFACRYGHPRCVELLMREGAETIARDCSGCTALHLALKFRKLDIARDLVKKYPSGLSISDNKGRTALHEAVLTGSEELCRLLAENGANLHAKDTFGRTPLMLACSAGLANIVECLFKEYNDLSHASFSKSDPAAIEDKEGATILHYAVLRNNLPLLQEIVNHSKLTLDKAKNCGSTAMHIAASMGYREALETLIDAGARLNVVDSKGATPLHRASDLNKYSCVMTLLEKGADVEIRDHNGKLAWHLAAAAGHQEVLTALLKQLDQSKVKQLIYDAQQYTPLYYACVNGQQQCVDVLLDWASTMDKDIQSSILRPEASTGRRVIHVAASRPEGSKILASLLRFASSAVSWVDGEMKTPLHWAAEHDCTENVELLLHHGADVSATDIEGRTPLHLACARGSVNAAQLLLANGSAHSQRDWRGRQPLIYAAETSHTALVKLLLEAGCSINAVDDHGSTAMHAACAANSAEVVQLLIDAGCDLTARNDNGATVLETCIARRSKDAATAIIMHDKWEIAMCCNEDRGTKVMNELIKKMPSVAKTVLDQCYTPDLVNSDPTNLFLPMKFNFKYINRGDEACCRFSTWPVQTMALYGRLELLRHPLVRTMIDRRWGHRGEIYMLCRILFLVTHVATLAFYSFSVASYRPSNYVQECPLSNNTNITTEEQCRKTVENATVGQEQRADGETLHLQIILLLTSLLFLGLEIPSFKQGIWCFNMTFPQDLFTVIMTTCTIIFISPPGFYPSREFQWKCGSTANLTGLLSLIFSTRWITRFGIISVSISYMMSNLFVIVYFYILVYTFSYGAVFYLLLQNKDGFNDLGSSVASVVNMAVGEINFYEVFIKDNYEFKWSAIWAELLFLFTVNFTLINFLTAYTIRNLKVLLKDAETYTRTYEIAEILRYEAIFSIKKMEDYYTSKLQKSTPSLTKKIMKRLKSLRFVVQVHQTKNTEVESQSSQVKRIGEDPSIQISHRLSYLISMVEDLKKSRQLMSSTSADDLQPTKASPVSFE